jgi:hypothetical protein
MGHIHIYNSVKHSKEYLHKTAVNWGRETDIFDLYYNLGVVDSIKNNSHC